MNGYIISMTVIIVLGAILEILMPDNDYKKYIKPVLGIIIVLTMVKPLISGFAAGEGMFDINFYDGSTANQEEYFDGVYQNNIKLEFDKKLSEDVLSFLKSKFYNVSDCVVRTHIEEEQIYIDSITVTTFASEENEKVGEAISKRYAIDTEKVFVKGNGR